MSLFLKLFNTTAEYNAYTADTENFILPNVSCAMDDLTKVYYNPYVSQRMDIITYRATAKLPETTSNKTSGLHTNAFNTTIKSHTFENGVGTIEFNEDVTTVGDNAFYGSTHTSIDIPDSVTSIGSQAFYGCRSLTSIVIPSGVTSIGNGAFSGCTSLSSIDIPSGVTSIGRYAFESCSGLTSCTIGSGVTSIGDYAFRNCSGLTRLNSDVDGVFNLPSGVTSIGNQAFYQCDSLTSINIPSGVTSIGDQAFRNCSGLTSIVCNATAAPTISSYTFQNVKAGGTLTVPIGSSGYDVWMGTSNYYLGSYNWTKVEQ